MSTTLEKHTQLSKGQNLILHLPISLEQIKEYEDNLKLRHLTYNPIVRDPKPVGSVFPNEKSSSGPVAYNTSDKYEHLSHVQKPAKSSTKMIVTSENTKSTMDIEMCLEPLYPNWGNRTNLHCWWDCFPFEGAPCTIPVSSSKNKTQVMGCFCSFNCALAYVCTHTKVDKWRLISNIITLYKKSCGDEEELKPAPKPQCLNIFGGKETIETFRKNFKQPKHDYWYIYPPFEPIKTYVQQTSKEKAAAKKSMTAEKDDGQYVRRRKKPLQNMMQRFL